MAEHALVADPQRLEGGADHVSASRAIIARMTAASCRSFGRSAASFMRRIARRGGGRAGQCHRAAVEREPLRHAVRVDPCIERADQPSATFDRQRGERGEVGDLEQASFRREGPDPVDVGKPLGRDHVLRLCDQTRLGPRGGQQTGECVPGRARSPRFDPRDNGLRRLCAHRELALAEGGCLADTTQEVLREFVAHVA